MTEDFNNQVQIADGQQLHAAEMITDAQQVVRNSGIAREPIADRRDNQVEPVTSQFGDVMGAVTETARVVDNASFQNGQDSTAQIRLNNEPGATYHAALGVSYYGPNKVVEAPAQVDVARYGADGKKVYSGTINGNNGARAAEIIAGRAHREIVAKALAQAAGVVKPVKS